MPKASDKKGKPKKLSAATSNNSCDIGHVRGNESVTLKRKRLLPTEGIAKSKQLASKSIKTRTRVARTVKNTEPRICGNGKPMPSLAELEQMFEDSDDDRESITIKNTECKTPEQKPQATSDELVSPRTLKHITTKMMDMISNLPTITLDDEGPRPPVIPQKKRKKSDIPYIVGCKERPQVPWQPKTKFGIGNDDYGIDENNSLSEDEDNPCKKKRRSQKVNISKSIFNAKSDEIAAQLKELENRESSCNSSPDSNKTIGYDYPCNNSPSQFMSKSFSPLPSTSRDMDTFLKNDQRLNESLQNISCINDTSSQGDVEIMDVPCETIIIDDTITDIKTEATKPLDNYEDDECCIIIDSDINKRDTNSPIKVDSPKDDIYGSLDLTKDYENDEITEVIDVDNVIAENEAIIEKYCKSNSLDTVTLVEPSMSHMPKQCSISKDNHSPDRNTLEVNNVTNTNHESQNRSNIANAVENFFNGPATSYRSTTNTIDLSNVQETLNSVTSWISSLSSNLNGNINRSNDVMIINNQNRTHQRRRPSQNSRENLSIPTLPRHNSQNNYGLPSNFIVTNITCVPNNRLESNVNKTSQVQKSPTTNEPPQNTVMRSLGDCPICMDNLANTAVASTLCGHVFCMDCIKAAIKANGKKCPTCRKGLKGVGYHQLFL